MPGWFPQGIVQEERLHSEQDAAPFNWLKQWYPLAVAADLDPGRPHAQQLMGEIMLSASRVLCVALDAVLTASLPVTPVPWVYVAKRPASCPAAHVRSC